MFPNNAQGLWIILCLNARYVPTMAVSLKGWEGRVQVAKDCLLYDTLYFCISRIWTPSPVEITAQFESGTSSCNYNVLADQRLFGSKDVSLILYRAKSLDIKLNLPDIYTGPTNGKGHAWSSFVSGSHKLRSIVTPAYIQYGYQETCWAHTPESWG